jgi:hypothetical protein
LSLLLWFFSNNNNAHSHRKMYNFLLVQYHHCPMWPVLPWSLMCTLILLCYALSVKRSCRNTYIQNYKFHVHFPLHRFWRVHPRPRSSVAFCITCYFILFLWAVRITLFNP